MSVEGAVMCNDVISIFLKGHMSIKTSCTEIMLKLPNTLALEYF